MSLAVETDLVVPMRDGVKLHADLYRPSGAGRWPTVLLRTPYDRTLGSAYGQQLNAVQLAGAGYSVVVQDVRGRFASEGAFYPFRAEGRDGVDTFDWIAAQPWSTGAVGTVGSSYCGYAQALAAGHGHPAHACMVPAFAPLDARSGWVYEGDGFCLGFNLSWTLAHIAARDRRTPRPNVLLDALDDWPETVLSDPLEQRALRSTQAADYFFDWLVEVDNQDYWSDLSACDVGDSAPPALIVAGWFDLFAKGSLALHRELAASSAGTHRLVVGPWDHSPLPLRSSAGETEFGVAAALDLQALQLRWLDAHLRGADEPDWPAARMFTTGSNSWEEWGRWPPEATSEAWYLAPARALAPAAPARQSVERFTAHLDDPTPTVGGPLCCWQGRLPAGQADQARRAGRPDVLSFCSTPLDAELVVGGHVIAEIWSGTSGSGADVFVTLVDVDHDGRGLNVAEGLRRLRDAGAEPELFRIELGSVAHAFAVGHRVRLDVAAMSFPRFDRFLDAPSIERTVAIGESRVVLPVLR